MRYFLMLIELTIALAIGILVGTFTGLFPGIHINLVAAFLISSLAFFDFVEPRSLAVFIVAMAITHTFIDFIPSIFLGAPEEESFLAVLPGHQLLREGKGFEACVMVFYGALIAIPTILIFTFVFVYFLPSFYEIFKTLIPFILIFASLYLIFREENFLTSLTVFAFAGILGALAFNLPVEEPLLPLLTGLFGISGLLISVKNKVSIPKQKIIPVRKIKLKRKNFLKASFASFIVAPFCSFLPGIGSGHASVIASELLGSSANDKKTFLFLVGAVNVIVMALSFVTLYAIGRTRSGAAAAIQEILGELTKQNLFLIILIIFVVSILSFFIGIFLAKRFSYFITKINYTKLSYFVIGLLILINLLLSNLSGLLVLVVASALGVYAILSGARRINLMGSLIIPTVVFYLTF